MMLRSIADISKRCATINGYSSLLAAGGHIPSNESTAVVRARHITTVQKISSYDKNKASRRRRCLEHSHFRSTSAAATSTAEYDEENDVNYGGDKELLLNSSQPKVLKNTALTNPTKPRLQALRERLERDPPAQTFLSKPSSSDKISHSNSKSIHWKELLRQSTEAPPLQTSSVEEKQKLLVPQAAEQPGVLTDRFGRHHNYLRISLAERCNLRCTYCMPPEGVPLQPESYLLQTPEILSLAQHFQNHGVNKIRLTGGEPTLRKDLVTILQGLKDMGGFEELAITTNGVTLAKNLDSYLEAGLNRVNISLDTLHPEKFEELTRRPAGYFSKVWDAIEAATKIAPSELVTKINVVVMKGVNDHEVASFCELQQQFPNLHVRFIEYMPFTENGWKMDRWVPYKDLLQHLDQQDNVQLVKLPEVDPNDTTKWYTTAENYKQADAGAGGIGRIGFITSMSQPFCNTCNRLRLTSDGQIKVCLFDGNSTISLRDALREGATPEELGRLIQHALRKKHFSLGGHASPQEILEDSDSNRPMTLIGG